MGFITSRGNSRASTGTAAPATTPQRVGDTFYDTTNGDFYVAGGTSSSADWKKVLIAT